MLIIPNLYKPTNCTECSFNDSDTWCKLDRNHITIDRDDYSPLGRCPLIEIPEGVTNGDVIKTMFSECCSNMGNLNNGIVVDFMGDLHTFNKDWWNAPYKVESEVKE